MTDGRREPEVVIIEQERVQDDGSDVWRAKTISYESHGPQKLGLMAKIGLALGGVGIIALFLTFFAVALVIAVPLMLWGAWKLRRNPSFRAMQERMRQAQRSARR